MKPAPFAFARPTSLAQALDLLAANPDAKVLAGGQSLVPLLSMRLASPALLIDINAIDALSRITADSAGVRVGAVARHAEVEAHPQARRVQPLLAKALRLVAHPAIRNRGTTVGSIVHADAAAEMPAVLRLLGGHVTARSTRGSRTIPADELFAGPLESTVRHDELVTEAFFPALSASDGVACDEVARRHGDYALCGVAAVVSSTPDGRVTSVRAGYLSVCEVPTVVELSDVFGAGEMTDRALADAAELALDSLDPVDDIHATADYRSQLARVLTRRVVRAAYDDSRARQAEVVQ
ncbi:FAD binding domain-containing protein [Saccharomonospora xinjiangensis]|uniref:Aerobic-type carbon monoxide dehydrogenase, middle subunit CoxM/CutM-like protein n=1 Tax=Saccharomonospora xinjiangensis XJ-54 TaxID=882086 RepID=I0V793_9PSEU|nr:FAD binding domain-containing protein [Saccharomonospora xinjiangensis]EID55996.1 aerobic-type carbon monoxide dehydrogenase, middle subunit CoxM/CutM-like protein [Saccharomonospora xinjiangensis XJ-54]